MNEISLAEAMRQQAEDGADGEAANRVNPVAVTIQTYRAKTRGWLHDGTVEWEAKRLHAESSFEPWNKLTDVEKELWYHLARVKLMG
jgi:hypothetical protein